MEKRNSNIELLRLISILMIVISHYSVHSGVELYNLPLGFNRVLLESMTLGNIGVIIFVIITGYYLINKDNPFSFKKILLLYFQIFFYSVSIYIIFVILHLEVISVKSFISAIFPLTTNSYWFASTYVILYVFSTFINKFLNSLNKKNFRTFLILLLAIFSVYKTICFQPLYFNELLQLFMFYCIGAYLGKYEEKYFNNRKLNLCVLLISFSIIVFSIIAFDFVGLYYGVFAKHSTYLLSRTSFLSILIAVSLFNLFIQNREFSNKFLNTISSCVFAVYLISDNNYIRSVLWTKILNIEYFVEKPSLIVHMIVSVLFVFACCIIIELIRKFMFNKVNNKITFAINDRVTIILDHLKNSR